jgi:hypothetical protein
VVAARFGFNGMAQGLGEREVPGLEVDLHGGPRRLGCSCEKCYGRQKAEKSRKNRTCYPIK